LAKQAGLFAVEIGQKILERVGDFFAVGSVEGNFQAVGCSDCDLAG
jgi:hypothetical protein